MRIVKMLAAASALLSAPSFAADWVNLGKGQSGLTLFVDATSIVKGSEVLSVWVKFDKTTETKHAPGDPATVLNHMEFKCVSKELRTTYQATYDVTGLSVHTQSYPVAQFQPFIPESIGDEVGRVMCHAYDPPEH